MTKATNGNDELLGTDLVDIIKGLGGNDVIHGFAGDDELHGGLGNDTLLGGSGNDLLAGGSGNDTADFSTSFSYGLKVDLRAGTATALYAPWSNEADVLTSIENVAGSDYTDNIYGDDNANTLSGNGGSDFFRTGLGADHIDGGAGSDMVAYDDSKVGVTVNLTTAKGSHGTAQGDTFVSIEFLQGSNHGDTLTGTSDNNTIQGLVGSDVIRGMGGADWIGGEEGNDALYGGKGFDTLEGGLGADHLDGGSDRDIATYIWDTSGINVDLQSGKASGSGESKGDTVVNVEDVICGSGKDVVHGSNADNALWGNSNDDKLYGRDGWDNLDGGGGNDQLSGGSGNDTVVGGQGRDTLDGGKGADTFGFFMADTGSIASTRDVIVDFNEGTDRINLKAIDANGWTTGNDDQFMFISTAALADGVAGQVRSYIEGDHTVVEGDYTGDAHADFQIELLGIHTLSDLDFIL